MTSLTALLSAAAALGGVLAVAGSWSRGIRPGAIPHLSVGAVAGVGSGVALQFAQAPALLTWMAAAAAGALCGAALHQAGHAPPRPDREVPVGGDLVTLAGLLGVAALLAPPGPGAGTRTLLGGQWPAVDGSSLLASLAVLALGAGLAAALALAPAAVLPLRARSVLAGAGTAALAAAAAQGAAAAHAY
ncbi:MAG TPA: hypothetical protein VNU01_03965, partial [Egibacteraceae bacterium]|nr:hypothetical protein [Egibacteraceae bacterium]